MRTTSIVTSPSWSRPRATAALRLNFERFRCALADAGHVHVEPRIAKRCPSGLAVHGLGDEC